MTGSAPCNEVPPPREVGELRVEQSVVSREAGREGHPAHRWVGVRGRPVAHLSVLGSQCPPNHPGLFDPDELGVRQPILTVLCPAVQRFAAKLRLGNNLGYPVSGRYSSVHVPVSRFAIRVPSVVLPHSIEELDAPLVIRSEMKTQPRRVAAGAREPRIGNLSPWLSLLCMVDQHKGGPCHAGQRVFHADHLSSEPKADANRMRGASADIALKRLTSGRRPGGCSGSCQRWRRRASRAACACASRRCSSARIRAVSAARARRTPRPTPYPT